MSKHDKVFGRDGDYAWTNVPNPGAAVFLFLRMSAQHGEHATSLTTWSPEAARALATQLLDAAVEAEVGGEDD